MLRVAGVAADRRSAPAADDRRCSADPARCLKVAVARDLSLQRLERRAVAGDDTGEANNLCHRRLPEGEDPHGVQQELVRRPGGAELLAEPPGLFDQFFWAHFGLT